MGRTLRAAIIVDFQNVHLTGHGLFESSTSIRRHESLLDPLLYAQQLMLCRNRAQLPGHAHAEVTRVHVFRGHPSPDVDPLGYRRNLAHKTHWERDERVTVTLRPLKYEFARDAEGRPAVDEQGDRIVIGGPREKGVDVLCALEAVRQSQDPTIDVVILATSDSDIAPALDEVMSLGGAKVETSCWWDEERKLGYRIHPIDRKRSVWCTRLPRAAFVAARDLKAYD